VPAAGGHVDYVSLWPSGFPQPYVSTLDDVQGLIVSNAAIVPAGTVNGGISVFNYGPATTDVIIDMNGFFAAPSDLNGNTAIGLSALTSNTTGTNNTAVGSSALAANSSGVHNTAVGADALAANTTGGANTAVGNQTLESNTSGGGNTAVGGLALTANTTGSGNTTIGQQSLLANTTGNNNTANGQFALQSNNGNNNTATGQAAMQANTSGCCNVAAGQNALNANTTGSNNAAFGQAAMLDNTTGVGNTASGYQALQNNTTGNGNTAIGYQAMMTNNAGGSVAVGQDAMQLSINACCDAAFGQNALQNNTFGQQDTAVGGLALSNNTTGNGNIALGFNAATNVSGSNSNNIHIGNTGASGDSGVIRIGTESTQTSAYIAGIWNNTPNATNLLVCVDANGDLGTTGCTNTPSSRRFKEQISDMGDSSGKLFQLRPVTFFYKPEYDDGSHSLQYGLIAEEVAKVYPNMVGYDKDGQPSSVKYQALTPMLLNEVQKQAVQNRTLEERVAALEAVISSLTSTVTRPASSQ
jgi:hypothetical protein